MSTNLTMTRGETGVFQASLTDAAGAPVNDPTASYRMTIKRSPADLDTAAFAQVTATQTTPGVAMFTIQPAVTTPLSGLAVLVYDISVIETGGRVTSLASGSFTVLDSVGGKP